MFKHRHTPEMYITLFPTFVCLIFPVRLADKDTNLCPFTKYERYFRVYYPVTGYIYCTTGCCGYIEDRRCCPATSDSTGVYVGCATAAVVLVVTIVAITVCCVVRHHRKQVVVGIAPEVTRHRLAQAGYIQRGVGFPRTSDSMYTRRAYDGSHYWRAKLIDRPPPYELAVYTIPEEEPSVSHTEEGLSHTQRSVIQQELPIPHTHENKTSRFHHLKPKESEQASSTSE